METRPPPRPYRDAYRVRPGHDKKSVAVPSVHNPGVALAEGSERSRCDRNCIIAQGPRWQLPRRSVVVDTRLLDQKFQDGACPPRELAPRRIDGMQHRRLRLILGQQSDQPAGTE